jgi:mevalonate pyrophosphate decarboxylase
MCDMYTLQRRSLFVRCKPIISSEKLLHKNYDRKSSVAKNKSLAVSLKGFVTKTNWLVVNRQSQSNSLTLLQSVR